MDAANNAQIYPFVYINPTTQWHQQLLHPLKLTMHMHINFVDAVLLCGSTHATQFPLSPQRPRKIAPLGWKLQLATSYQLTGC